MKIKMPEPHVARDGSVSIKLQIIGDVWRDEHGWSAKVRESRRVLGRLWGAGGMKTRAQAVRWVVIHALDWRTQP